MLNQNPSIIIYTVIAATASFVLSPLCCRLAESIGAMDIPSDGRRMHRRPIPRTGGVAIFTALLISLFLSDPEKHLPILIGGTVIFAVGLTDDIVRLSPTAKLNAQSAASAVTLFLADGLIPKGAPPIAAILSFLWILTLTNAFNLIDGLDGLCSGTAILCALFLFIAFGAPSALLLAAALLGFLPYNRHPASMFLGDSGAMLSGYILAVTSLSGLSERTEWNALAAVAFIFALPLTDTVSSFLRRIINGLSPFSPDRLHLHHRLVDGGLSHHPAVRLLVLSSAASGALGISILTVGLALPSLICLVLMLAAVICITPLAAARR